MTSTDPITDAELDEWERIERAATAGPWRLQPEEFDDWGMIREGNGWPVANSYTNAMCPRAEAEEARRLGRTPRQVAANGEFITEARNAFPRLLAEHRKLRAHIISRWRTMDTAPTEPGSKIEIFLKDGDMTLSRNVVDLHSWATLQDNDRWWFHSSTVQPATTKEMKKAGAVWRPIGPLPERSNDLS